MPLTLTHTFCYVVVAAFGVPLRLIGYRVEWSWRRPVVVRHGHLIQWQYFLLRFEKTEPAKTLCEGSVKRRLWRVLALIWLRYAACCSYGLTYHGGHKQSSQLPAFPQQTLHSTHRNIPLARPARGSKALLCLLGIACLCTDAARYAWRRRFVQQR